MQHAEPIPEVQPRFELTHCETLGSHKAIDFPAEHWKHVRTANPIESTFATVRLRTDKTKGCLSRETALAMVLVVSRKWWKFRRRGSASMVVGLRRRGQGRRVSAPGSASRRPGAW